MSGKPKDHEGEDEGGVITQRKTERKLARPQLYKVLLHNDNYTSMEFVVDVLQLIFNRSEVDATAIMLHIHRNGLGVAGVYTREIAETKVQKTMALAKEAQFPLQCTLEPE
jgi:ATP-dependent Clp protease adaptor protein ClpS